MSSAKKDQLINEQRKKLEESNFIFNCKFGFKHNHKIQNY